MITIFGTPKNFEGIFKIIQINAIRSWRSLSKDVEIIIFGKSEGAQKIANEVSAIYYPNIKCSKNGVPLLSDLFHKANQIASFDILLFINSDILLPKRFIYSIRNVKDKFSHFLLVGHRWDLKVEKLINFNEAAAESLFWEMSEMKSKKASPAAIDYFGFRKNSLKKIPDFVVGRPGYDNWLIWYARRNFMPVVDISEEVKVIHQRHHYNFHNLKNNPKIFDRNKISIEEDGKKNMKLHGDRVLNLLDADFSILNGRIEKNTSKEYVYRNLGKLSIIFPEFSFFLNIYAKLYRMLLYKSIGPS
ncbi:MAG: hypothetical protein CMF99_01550 [Candidatus Marinimicrobia bacterium]|nr:hypothetical protein [Candidatus Neomarinimicrobiota bacterium]|tara:strand:+ start:3307 stop:4215 length:909 start_codon:yes stop_codon:yes gene_type:complete